LVNPAALGFTLHRYSTNGGLAQEGEGTGAKCRCWFTLVEVFMEPKKVPKLVHPGPKSP